MCASPAEVKREFRGRLLATRSAYRAFRQVVADPALSWVPPGHFYSPIPNAVDRNRATGQRDREDGARQQAADVDLRLDEQMALLGQLEADVARVQLCRYSSRAKRYYYDNPFFGQLDAMAYAGMLIHFRPRRLIEVGCGFSSALFLDLTEEIGLDVSAIFIEPYPDRLFDLLPPSTVADSLVRSMVQDVELSQFDVLESGDFLFVDSSHVSKAGSDLNFILFEVVPRLAAGVFVHFHDIFRGFEYPRGYIDEGRAWNECYLIRALLSGSSDFEVVLFVDECASRCRRAGQQPFAVDSSVSGGSLWIRKVR